jgi:hypothetical protein
MSLSYACSSWEYAVVTCLLKVHCLQNQIVNAVASFDGCTSVCEMMEVWGCFFDFKELLIRIYC